MFTRSTFSACFAASSLLVTPVVSDEAKTGPAASKVVVELFTSQGCSSCPPADEILAELADDPRVIPLALHVDYWDYLGWKDDFAKPQFSIRQKKYASETGNGTVYTPQMIIDGQTRIVGADEKRIERQIDAQASQPAMADLILEREGAVLKVELSPHEGMALPAGVIQLVTYVPSESIHVTHGENAGKTITYSHIVKSWDVWEHVPVGSQTISLQRDDLSDLPVAVLFQAPDLGPMFAAASLR